VSYLDLAAERLEHQAKGSRLPWHGDPVGFARDCIDWPTGTGLADYQAGVLQDLVDHRREAVRSLHGAGKTTTSALGILWFAVTRDHAGIDWKAPITAGAWRQLSRYLWPELHLWARRLRWDVIGRGPFSERTELLQLSLSLRHGQAFAVASSDPGLIEGAHAESLLFVFDESKSITPDVFDAAEGALGGPGEVFVLACSTPGEPSGRFYEIHSRKAGLEDWHCRHITLAEVMAAGRLSETWAAQRARQWGEHSAIYQNRVLGEFAAADEDAVIPLAWVEAANERWAGWQGQEFGSVTHLGVDVARSGADKTVLALRHGDVVSELRRYTLSDTMQTTGYVAAVLRANPQARPVVDVIGIGAGVVDRLREQGFKQTVAFNASERSTRKDRSGELEFLNARSAAWWSLREALDPAYGPVLALPPEDDLIGDLTAPHYSVTSSGRLQVESKDDIRKRLGRSTDCGDAVVQACFGQTVGQGAMFMEYWRGEKDRQDVVKAAAVHQRVEDKPVPKPWCKHRWQKWPNGECCVLCGGWRAPEQNQTGAPLGVS
jgi:hypothetical protein